METNHAIENARGWYASICDMLAAVKAAENDDDAREQAESRIYESVLAVDVRSGWYPANAIADAKSDLSKPCEFRILLTTGGPALQIQGELSEYGQPERAEMYWQDWGTPWTKVNTFGHEPDIAAPWSEYQENLLEFSRYFYFGD